MVQTKFLYHTYTAAGSDFRHTAQLLAAQLDKSQQLISVSFFGEVTRENYGEKLHILRREVSLSHPSIHFLISFIAQPTVSENGLTAEVVYLPPTDNSYDIKLKKRCATPYLLIEDEECKMLLMEGIRCNHFSDSLSRQANELFQTIASIFLQEGFRPSDILRQWNYIGQITVSMDGMQNYQVFNEARAAFYNTDDWHQHGYPAATGIGMSIQGLIISLIACRAKTAGLRIAPIDNPLQVAAHHYSQSKLISEDGLKASQVLATPKFERGKIILAQQEGICYVSGTAAIRGEESMNSLDARAQTHQTIENIQYLLSENNLKRVGITNFTGQFVSLRVYFKNTKDYAVIMTEIEKQWSGIPVIYTRADICRKELLVEIEGIARLSL